MTNILIIEDQADIRRLIRWALKPTGHDIREASGGQAGLDALRDARADLVLLDIRMPGALDGFEVCRRIRADPAHADLPVIILTADAFESDRVTAAQVGATSFLAKPFSPIELQKMVTALLAGLPAQAS